MTWQTQFAVVALAGGLAWLLTSDLARGALRRLRDPARSRPLPPRRRRRGARAAVAVLVAASAGLGAWAVAIAGTAATVGWVVLRQAGQARMRREQADVAGAANTIALLLAAGRIPAEAIMDAAEDHPCLASAATAVRVGGEVPDALESAAREPGRQGLATVAAAWRVCEATGAPVSKVIGDVVEVLRADREVAELIEAELSAARASGRVMAALPLFAIGLGGLVGADPLGFLLGDPTGQVLLVSGVGLACVGVVWTERIARPVVAGRGEGP